MKPSSNLIFFGNERLSSGFSPVGAPVLQALINAGYHISAVVANHHSATSRKTRELEVETVARANAIPVFLPQKLSEIAPTLAAFQAPAAMLVAYGKIIPQSIIDLFPQGIINIHPSLLPQYRGSTPIEQALIDGIPETGVSLMKIVKAMDAGPIYAQERVAITNGITKQELTQKLLNAGAKLLIEQLPAILNGQCLPKPQNEAEATFTPRISKQDGIINWELPAISIERRIRAYAGWPKSHAIIFEQPIIITKARVAYAKDDGQFVMPCGQNFLEILELVGPSGRTMKGQDFLNGYKR